MTHFILSFFTLLTVPTLVIGPKKEVGVVFGSIVGQLYAEVGSVFGDIQTSAHVEGNVGHVFGNVKGFVRGNIGTIEGSILAGGYVFGNIDTIGGDVRGHVQGNIRMLRGNVAQQGRINGDVQRIDGSVGTGTTIAGHVGSVGRDVNGTVQKDVDEVHGAMGPNASINGKNADEYNLNHRTVGSAEPSRTNSICYEDGCSQEFMCQYGLSPHRATGAHFTAINGQTRVWAYARREGFVACGVLRMYGNGLCAWLEGSDPVDFVDKWCPLDCRRGVVLRNGRIVQNGRNVSLSTERQIPQRERGGPGPSRGPAPQRERGGRGGSSSGTRTATAQKEPWHN